MENKESVQKSLEIIKSQKQKTINDFDALIELYENILSLPEVALGKITMKAILDINIEIRDLLISTDKCFQKVSDISQNCAMALKKEAYKNFSDTVKQNIN